MSIVNEASAKLDEITKVIEENKELAAKIAVCAGLVVKVVGELSNMFEKGKESKVHVDISVD